MNLNSPIFDRIRTQRSSAARPGDASSPRCQHPGCLAEGNFRAPMGRLREGQYFWFCIDHVRAYNASYNYFHGMSDEAVLLYQKEALTGHRPTWKMGASHGEDKSGRGRGPFGKACAQDTPRQRSRPPRHGVVALKALHVLGLDDDASASDIKARYKDLVKRLHPDSNGGDRSHEERLREIITAYNVLRSFRAI